jgi:crotonobetainyl-CoA:carnitine CoA-transferase CaiB-like acyl-CoA transferase
MNALQTFRERNNTKNFTCTRKILRYREFSFSITRSLPLSFCVFQLDSSFYRPYNIRYYEKFFAIANYALQKCLAKHCSKHRVETIMTPTGSAEVYWNHTGGKATGPLAGVRVLDLTTVVMGPSATQILGDLGADVLKVESPAGDSMRWIGPWRHPGMGPLYLQANRNKRGIVLDLKSVPGKARAVALAEHADVLVSNVRPQGLQRLGLDYESLRMLNPRLIYCAAVGYGAGGPDSGKAVYDDLMQAASGIAGLFRQVDGAPRYAPVNICDRIVGLYVANAVTSALYHREKTQEGQVIEVPMFETMTQFVLSDHMGGAAFVPAEGPMGYRRLLSRTRGPYATRDGHLSLVVYTDRHWRAFTALVGQPTLLDTDARFVSQESRTSHAEDVGRFLAQQLPARSNREWLEILHGIDIPACPVNSIEDLFDDPHLRAVGFFEDVEHPTEGLLRTCRFPVRFSASPPSVQCLAPNLGEHNAEIFGERHDPVREDALPNPTHGKYRDV